MTSSGKLQKILLGLCVCVIMAAAYMAHLVERDFGRIEVSKVVIMSDELIPMTAKIYRPKDATAENPMPGILALHGYQSDKEATTTFGTLEFARRGFVVVTIDQFGHGYSGGNASAKNASGSNNGYKFLKSLPFVDKNNLGIFGHSTGGLNAQRVAKQNPDHRAVNGQSANGGDMSLHNYLLTQGKYEELAGYREGTFPVTSLDTNPKRLAAFGMSEGQKIEWNKTYGSFADGTARRVDLVNGTHLGVMVNGEGTVGAIQWFNQALQGGEKGKYWLDPEDHIYYWREFFGLLALAFTIFSLLPLSRILLSSRFFAVVAKPVSHLAPVNGKSWWVGAALSIIVTMLTYPLLVQNGGAGEPIAAVIPCMPLEMGNGIVTWLLGISLISLFFFMFWRQRHKAFSLPELGLDLHSKDDAQVCVFGRSILFALILLGWAYLLVSIAFWLWGAEFRFLWPFLKPLTPRRFGLLLVYIWPALLFFFSMSLVLFGVMGQRKMFTSKGKVSLSWAFRNALFAAGGLLVLWCVHFIPDYMGAGPGFDVFGLPQYGGRWMMMLAVIIPQVITYMLLLSWFYARTGRIFLGTFVASGLMMWILTGGQVIGRFLE